MKNLTAAVLLAFFAMGCTGKISNSKTEFAISQHESKKAETQGVLKPEVNENIAVEYSATETPVEKSNSSNIIIVEEKPGNGFISNPKTAKIANKIIASVENKLPGISKASMETANNDAGKILTAIGIMVITVAAAVFLATYLTVGISPVVLVLSVLTAAVGVLFILGSIAKKNES